MNSSTTFKLLGLLLILIIVSFRPVLSAEFLDWDDSVHLTANPLTESLAPANLIKIFSTPVNGTYIPLTILTFALERQFFGLQPEIFHGINLLLHLLVTLSVFILGERLGLTRLASFLAAVIFGLHPLHVESVAWITARKDMLYSLFFIWSLIHYWHYLQTQQFARWTISLGLGVLAILAKPMALSLPLMLFVLDALKKRPRSVRVLTDKLPFALIIFSLAAITYADNARMLQLTWPKSFLLWIWSFSFYLDKFTWPFPLSPFYLAPQPFTFQNPAYQKSILIALFFILACIRGRKNNWFMLGALTYVLCTFYLWRMDYRDISVVADRFMYLPSLGFCFWVGHLIEDYDRQWITRKLWRRIWLCGWTLVFLTLPLLTYQQSQIWKSDATLLARTLQIFPNHYLALTNQGVLYHRAGQESLALKSYNRALAAKPDSFLALLNRGNFWRDQKQWQRAESDYSQALQIDPQHPQNYQLFMDRGTVRRRLGLTQAAQSDYTDSIRLKPDYFGTFVNRGNLFLELEDWRRAIADFTQAIKLAPLDPRAYWGRALAYEKLGEIELARQDEKIATTLREKTTEINSVTHKALINH